MNLFEQKDNLPYLRAESTLCTRSQYTRLRAIYMNCVNYTQGYWCLRTVGHSRLVYFTAALIHRYQAWIKLRDS